jgi:pyruvate formate-lyase/glycerol dehydratase family glycyl radical enzyme
MATTRVAEKEGRVQTTFEQVRDHLAGQFRDVPYVAWTGLPGETLEQEVQAYLEVHEGLPRVLQKAHAYRISVTRGRICVDPLDWFVDKVAHGSLVTQLRDTWYREAQTGPIRTESQWFAQATRLGAVRGGLDMGHISPGWENMFTAGLCGLIGKARQERERLGPSATTEQLAFYEAVEVVYLATIQLAERFAELAESMVPDHPDHAPRLLTIASACRRVPARRPRTFHEALQFAWLMHEMIEMEGEAVRSMGHFDRTMYPYYRNDVDSGRLSREQAKELIKFYWFKHYARTQGRRNGKNFVFGGQHADGSEVANELTYLALEAYGELNTPDPKLSVRFLPGTEDRLYRRVADLIRRGHNSFVLMNDVPAVAAQVKRGKTPEDARQYLPIGCYEPAVDGKEAGCTMNLVVNLAKALELALHDGVDPLTRASVGPPTGDPQEARTVEDQLKANFGPLDFLVRQSVTYVAAHERLWPRINPSPLVAGTIDDCLSRGLDIGEGGPHYNGMGCVALGLANACDSLMALRRAVYEDGQYTIGEVLQALESDFEGFEPMRQYLLNRIPKWGNNDAETDALARRIADHYCGTVHGLTNARGGPVQAALFSLDYQWTMGKATGALPDGRKAGVGLAPGVGAMTGRDMNGVTALMGSVTKLDFEETPNGSVLDVMLHPTSIRGEQGLEAMVNLIKTFFARGGYALQFNVLDAEMLKDAQRHPEHHASLQVRVTGWSVYFSALTRHEQDQMIARTVHGV